MTKAVRRRSIYRSIVFAAAVLFGALTAQTLVAQTTTGSGTDPLSIFQGLSADQQQQLMQRLGNGEGTGTSSITNARRAGQDLGNQTDQNGNPLYARPRRQTQDADAQPPFGPPVFRAQDWLIVEVDLNPLKPRPIDTTGESAAQVAAQLQQMQQLQQIQALQQQPQQQGNSAFLQGQFGQAAGMGQLNQLNQAGQVDLSQQDQARPPVEKAPTTEELERRQKLVDLIRHKDPYQLTREGTLVLPGFPEIPLAGLTELQGAIRLESDPTLKGFHFRLTRLPLMKAGLDALKPFGYDLFNESPSTFAPVTNVPVPADYLVGAGDILQVQLYGNQNRAFTVMVDRDGRVNFPELGPIGVAGQRFASVKEELEARVARQMIGVKASVSMSDTRAIQVFVLGEAEVPGSYTLSGLGTITSALYAAGGIKKIGSLRDIQLKRQGTVIQHLDLYDLLLRGDTKNDANLLPGDVVFIPPLGPTASVTGEVQRPAIYEAKPGTTIADLTQLAGGLTPDGEGSAAMVTRIDTRGGRSVLSVNLDTTGGGAGSSVSNGDVLRVPRRRPTLDAAVRVQGYLYSPGAVAFHQGLHLTDVLSAVDQLRPNADLHYVLVRREIPPDRRIAVFSVDLAAALALPSSAANIALAPRDEITVFDLQSGRDRIIQPLLDDLKSQSNINSPNHVVRVDGQVNVPGNYPLENGMHISDLIRAGGSLSDEAYGGKAELARYDIVDGESRQTQIVQVDLSAVMRGDPKANLLLQPYDTLSIKEISLWGDQERVTLQGQVTFPGTYAIKHGETLKSVLLRAGGLTKYAFPEGSVFTREELQKREQEQLDFLGQRMQTDISAMALSASAGLTLNSQSGGQGGATALEIGQTLLAQLRSARAVGRLVIDLPTLLRDPVGSENDVVMRDGDQLIVPRYQQEVTVIGEVQSVTSHLYRAELTRGDYIAMSGGVTTHANTSKIYVVRANGSVVANMSNFFRVGSNATRIQPGDTIVVPLDTEHIPPLPIWQAVTQIMYNVAIAVAAVHSL